MNSSSDSDKQSSLSRKSKMKKAGFAIAASAVMGVLAFGSAAPSQAITTQDPGPVGDFNWQGLNWHKRAWAGAPHYNGQWQASNVTPNADGTVTLSLTNPTGNAPQAAEMQTTKRGFGYGTYTTVIEKQVDAMQPEVVWGCMFTYDPDAAPGYAEIDLCEASAWGGGGSYGQNWPITQGHGYWWDAALGGGGKGNVVETFTPGTTLVQTHKLVWEKDKLTFETYEGEGLTGRLVKQTVLTGDKVPEPANERIHYNLWVIGGNGGNPDQVKPETAKVKSLTFVPAATTTTSPTPTTSPSPTPTPTPTTSPSPSPTPTPTPTVTKSTINFSVVAYKPASGYYAVLKWSGAQGDTVDLYLNGVKKTVPNNGYYKYMRPAGQVSTTFKVCDYTTACSVTYKVSKW